MSTDIRGHEALLYSHLKDKGQRPSGESNPRRPGASLPALLLLGQTGSQPLFTRPGYIWKSVFVVLSVRVLVASLNPAPCQSARADADLSVSQQATAAAALAGE